MSASNVVKQVNNDSELYKMDMLDASPYNGAPGGQNTQGRGIPFLLAPYLFITCLAGVMVLFLNCLVYVTS